MAANFQSNAVAFSTIFREYVGVKEDPESILDDFPVDIINKKINEFHFILGFASELYDNNGKGTGIFSRNWNFDSFSPEKVVNHKKNHKNMMVMISIGGHGIQYPFNPNETNVWIYNAVNSIKKVIQDYENYLVNAANVNKNCQYCSNIIDGIDINYEYIDSSVTKEVFSNCIGEVIKQLKNDIDISKSMENVSIAPTELLNAHYRQLFWDHKKDIKYVDYKFYNQILSTNKKFDDLFNKLVTDYAELKVFVGVSTDPTDKMNRDLFISGITKLTKSKLLPGVFAWNANDSANPPNNDIKPFVLEDILQDVLTKN